ncbi:hypothetical protein [Frigoriflavimonas asaccharolytica]|uniref:Uncharacterized protein n=1 Tax=Frigoriflavimonas asaccharolytica TaxID=2735899 RepID=A0A8J8GAR8_9FLAO|nr:hypothetical protein [Frigoriflavimonas asaccharolytica]NRS94071.1 hypothetical protein [Frigoriflavimonas asaccharolytica]
MSNEKEPKELIETFDNLVTLDKMKGNSFVLSCGSGCAMTYIAKQAEKNLQNVKVKFNVDVYIDETLSESYNESYVFYYDSSNQLKNIKRVGEKEDFLSSQSINGQNSFKKFADDLSTMLYGKKSSAIQENENVINLPIVGSKIEILDYPVPAKYNNINIDGEIPSSLLEINENIFIIWFEGDTERWYLVTFKNNKMFDKLLIGKSETVETENGTTDNYIDFKIEKNFLITLNYSSGKNVDSSIIQKTEKYQIDKTNYKIKRL